MKAFWKAYFAMFKDWRWVVSHVGVCGVGTFLWFLFQGIPAVAFFISYWISCPMWFYFLDYQNQKPLDI